MSNPEITEQTAPALPVDVLPPEPDPRALNPVRHGMGTEHVPPDERAEYAAHVQAVRASSGARGYLEERLADRAALALWRLERVARYEAAASSMARRKALQDIGEGNPWGPAAQVVKARAALDTLTGEDDEPERYAQELDTYAGMLDALAAGGSAGGLDVNAAGHLGRVLADSLETARVSPAQMVRAMMGRAPRRGEADSVADGEWTYEPEEVPGLLTLFRKRLGEHAPLILGHLAQRERLRAWEVREARREAEHAQADALALAALPGEKELEKVTRYEAHLERVLYRALHDLEASRREREGKPDPGLLRGVLDEGERGG